MDFREVVKIKHTMKERSSDELAHIWSEHNKSKWSTETFEAVRQILQERGRKLPGTEAPKQTAGAVPPGLSKYEGVKGWLLLFCVSLTILLPLSVLYGIFQEYDAMTQLSRQFPFLRTYTPAYIVLSLIVVIYSLYTGHALWTKKNGAVRTARIFLGFYFVSVVVIGLLPFMVGIPSILEEVLQTELRREIFRASIYFGVWFLYFNRSKRVKATYRT
ncbi:MAG: DUF2569 domain-containing protein [bacterium]|nr:DUF2569 domain-containing protein [bacterium]